MNMATTRGPRGFRPKPRQLIAVDLAFGPQWLAVVERAWAARSAVFPLDRRIPPDQRRKAALEAGAACIVADGGTEQLPSSQPVSPGTALVVATAGTSGRSKLVELSFEALEFAVEASRGRLGLSGKEPWVACLPLCHVGGFLILARSLAWGCPLYFADSADVDVLNRLPGRSCISLVPTQLWRALEARANLAKFEVVLVGGDRLDPRLRRRAEAVGVRVVETYGLTESCGGVVYDGIPFPRTAVTIAPRDVNAPALSSSQPTADGIVHISGPTIMTGYRRIGASAPKRSGAAEAPDPEAEEHGETAISMRDGLCWLETQDTGRLTSDGRIEVLGRTGDAITSGGETFYPRPIEEILESHPAVAEACVVGLPDPEWGQRCVAAIVPSKAKSPRNGAIALARSTAEELRAFMRTRLPPHQVPKQVLVVDSLPRTVTGKLIRAQAARLLRRLLKEDET